MIASKISGDLPRMASVGWLDAVTANVTENSEQRSTMIDPNYIDTIALAVLVVQLNCQCQTRKEMALGAIPYQ